MTAGTLVPAVSQPPADRVTMTWFDPRKTDFEKELNFGKQSFGSGDMGLVKDTIFDPETCEKAGTVLVRFQFFKQTAERDGFFYDDGGLILPDGKLAFSLFGKFSEFESEGGAFAAVTGGTGAYRDVRGEFSLVEGQEMCDRKGSLITADLVLE